MVVPRILLMFASEETKKKAAEIHNRYFIARCRPEVDELQGSHYLLRDGTWSTIATPNDEPLGYFDTAQEAIEHLHKSLQCNTNTHPAPSNNSEIS